MSSKRIRGARLYRDGRLQMQDIWIEGEKVQKIDSRIEQKADENLDAAGFDIFPGAIDVHVHFRDPGLENKEGWLNGSRAAVRGGVCCVLEIQNNEPLSINADRIRERQSKASQGLVDFGCYGNLLPDSLDALKEMAALSPAFKLFMGGSTGMAGIPDRALLKKLFQAAAQTGRPIVAHCEDENILSALRPQAGGAAARDHHRLRPPEAERSSIALALELVKETGASLHVFHLSTAAGVDLIARAKKEKLPVTASVSFHNLIFSCKDTEKWGNYLKVNPPIQSLEDQNRLREAVRDGTIDVVATDHAPHFREEKERPYSQAPSGIPSVEFFYPLLLDLVEQGIFPLTRAVESVSQTPAKIFGIQGKGSLQPGMDADMVLFRRDERKKIEKTDVVSRAGWTPYEGRSLPGLVQKAMIRGHWVFQEGHFLDQPWGKAAQLFPPSKR